MTSISGEEHEIKPPSCLCVTIYNPIFLQPDKHDIYLQLTAQV